MDHLAIAKQLDTARPAILAQTVDLMTQDWLLIERFPNSGRERYLLDMELNLAALVKSVRYRSPMINEDHMRWRREMLVKHACTTGVMRQSYAHLWGAISAQMPADGLPVIYDYLMGGLNALAYSDPHTPQIAAAHELLAEDAIAGSYDAHWHWQAAYGEEGRQRALYDVWFLLDYALDAVGTRHDSVFTQHAHWMRERLWQRHLTTTHMQQWFWLLTQSAEQRLPPTAAAQIRRLLNGAQSALLPENESGRALLAAQDTLVFVVAQQLVAQGLAAQPEQAALEVGWYVAYLADGLAQHSPAGLVSYTHWMQHWFATQGLPDTPLRQSYAALAQAMSHELPEYIAHEAITLLRVAQAAL
ncbi:MAG: hypothetical protein H7Z42_14415 [Roseiflexaceae bacterium]|nr:hypothetical protein [Roseiflexaceae bacterium]